MLDANRRLTIEIVLGLPPTGDRSIHPSVQLQRLPRAEAAAAAAAAVGLEG